MKKAGLVLILLLLVLGSCKVVTRMDTKEIQLINSGSESMPMKVLVVTNMDDSVVLRKQSVDVNYAEDKILIHKLIERLKVTMKVESGVGIAAPQVGLLRNIFLFVRIDKPDRPVEVAINPRILNHSAETIIFEGDGCLSVPDKSGNSFRYSWVEVEYTNENGVRVRERLNGGSRTEDFTGIIFQHEFDHLNGVLYTDKLAE